MAMTTFLTILIFTLATAAAAEISIWGPERRARQEIGNRLRGLRVSAGRAPVLSSASSHSACIVSKSQKRCRP